LSNALLSDVEARAERRRTRTQAEAWRDLAMRAWRRSQDAQNPAETRRWLERAHRLAPRDGTVAAALAGSRLRDNEPAAAAALFRPLAERDGLPDAWIGLAACAHVQGDPARAHEALASALRCAAPTATLRALAEAASGRAGWCGLTTDGLLTTGRCRPVSVRLDGIALTLGRSRRLPEGWRQASVLEVDGPHGPMLGSPLPVAAFAGVEGVVEGHEGGLKGWVWHPADPARNPVMTVEGPMGHRTITAIQVAEDVTHSRPLARPRRLMLTAAEVAALGAPLSVRGPDGRHLLGSPLDPGLEARAAADPAHAGFAPVWADVIGPHHPAPHAARPPVDVIVPVYRGAAETLACIRSVLESLPRGARLIVVDDASPDLVLVAALQALARRRRITLLRLGTNRGFPAAANAGLLAAAGRDAVLLNSDTLTPPGWLERLRDAAYSASDIGAVTPLTNDGTIVSYPDAAGGNPVPDLGQTIALDRLAQRANGAATVDLPVGVGFCLYLRRDCLDQVGLLRDDLFAQGYGEENDLCLRARHRGWRSVAAAGVFVAHVGAASFGAAREHLRRRNGAILERLHPGYDAMVAGWQAADPLSLARRRMDALRWSQGRRPGAVIHVAHSGGGGVDVVVAGRAQAAAAAGLRPIILRPRGGGVAVAGQGGQAFPNLVFPMPKGMQDLVRLLRPDKPRRVELHHLLGHHHSVAGLAQRLGVEAVSVVHDYARFCPRIALVGPERRYCGEPDVEGCVACTADQGSLLEDDTAVPVLLERSAAELAQASLVIAPSVDAAVRMRRHFPAAAPMVEPWEDDATLPPLAPVRPGRVRRVAVIGAIGIEKGFGVLLACARDARARLLPLEFVVVGFTADDERLMDSGPVFVTGEYREQDAVALIRAQAAQVAFIPSIWPETWCFALTRAWQAGLPAAVFDIGAQAERTRRTGRGWPLPLGLTPPALNDALLRLDPTRLRLAPGTPASQCPPQFPAP
jgi:GT2 family glycosyltransferase/glycosyltransferase involved in cell wall biosynthesis